MRPISIRAEGPPHTFVRCRRRDRRKLVVRRVAVFAAMATVLCTPGLTSADVIGGNAPTCPEGASPTSLHAMWSQCRTRPCDAEHRCARGSCTTREYCVVAPPEGGEPDHAVGVHVTQPSECPSSCEAGTCQSVEVCLQPPPPTSGPLSEPVGEDDLFSYPSRRRRTSPSARGCTIGVRESGPGFGGAVLAMAAAVLIRLRRAGCR